MVIRYFIVLFGLCFSNLALAYVYEIRIHDSLSGGLTYYSNNNTSSRDLYNSYVDSKYPGGYRPVRSDYKCSGGYDSYCWTYYYGIHTISIGFFRTRLSDCVISPDQLSCSPPDEGCEDLSSSYSVTGGVSSACIKLPSGSSCQSSCKSGICVDVGDGVHDHTLTGASCSPYSDSSDVCEINQVTGQSNCFSSPYNPNPTNPVNPNVDSGFGGTSSPVDISSGSGGGSVLVGGGSTSGDFVDSPIDASGLSRDYTVALNQIIANQHETNNSVLSVVNNQAHSYNALLSIRSAVQGTRGNTVESNQLLTDILAQLESMASASGGSGAADGDGSSSGADATYELLANAEVPELPGQSSVLPDQVVDFSNFADYIKTDYFGVGAGSCPPDYSITIPGFSDFTITYQPFCDFAVLVRPVIILLAWVAFILSLRNLRA